MTRAPDSQLLAQSRHTTLAALSQIDDSTLLRLTRLTLPEIQSIKQEIAQVFPAGNLPAFVLSGLVKLKGRAVGPSQVNQDITVLLRGISLIPQGLYGLFIAGPATVLYAYQKLLQLAGKDIASAFPYGTWQFYLQFALREDTARHTNETVGFHRAFSHPPASSSSEERAQKSGKSSEGARSINLAGMATAWTCAAIELLYRYDDLLAADWTERVMMRLVVEEAAESGMVSQQPFASMLADWNRQRPYQRPPGAVDYIAYREATFQHFIHERINALPAIGRERFRKRYQTRLAEELSDYQEQMTILAMLSPDRYQEHRQPIPLWQALVAFVWNGCTFLLVACQRDERGSPLCFPSAGSAPPVPLYVLPDGELCDANRQLLTVDRSGRVFYRESGGLLGRLRAPAPEIIHAWMTAILSTPPTAGESFTLDRMLAQSPRTLQPQLRQGLPEAAKRELATLRRALIVLNWTGSSANLPLAYIRRGHRGVGDHALTIFRTEQSIVFDQSHVFFDGMWGMAVSEVLTNNAIHWYRRLEKQPPAPPPVTMPLALTSLQASPSQIQLSGASQGELATWLHPRRSEAAAESSGVEMRRLRHLRQWLSQRGVPLTINDLLLLYRFLHATRYQPSPVLRKALDDFGGRAASPEAHAAYKLVEDTLARFRETNPALLIPMDASNVSPKERIFPTIFRNPLTEIQDRFAAAHKCYQEYRAQPDAEHWPAFDQTRRELLAYLKAFGELLDTLKAVTMRGESFNTATIRLLGHLPPSMQHILDQIPQHINVLNEIIKGNEVFSNVGRVAPGASLARFISAKDDGQTKELVWGFLTDDEDRMHISLRDLRPFVPSLLALGETGLADMLAQDYAQSYVQGFNRFVVELGALIAVKGPDESGGGNPVSTSSSASRGARP